MTPAHVKNGGNPVEQMTRSSLLVSEGGLAYANQVVTAHRMLQNRYHKNVIVLTTVAVVLFPSHSDSPSSSANYADSC